jgi:hypothetical protein
LQEQLPPVHLVRQFDTHRLIPAQYASPGDSFRRLTSKDSDRQRLANLSLYTSDLLSAHRDELPGVTRQELLVDLPNADIINASFCYARPGGARFSSSHRGAWYAAFSLETAQAEVIYHRSQMYAEIDRFYDTVTYCDFLADFSGAFHDLRGAAEFSWALDPDNYVRSQQLAEQLLGAGALGVVYPSVRDAAGTCLACFRPAAVVNVRRATTYQLKWEGAAKPQIHELSSAYSS